MIARSFAFIVRRDENVLEAIRSAVGLAVENRRVAVFLVGARLQNAGDEARIRDYLGMLDDMEAQAFTTEAADAGVWPLVAWIDNADLARELAWFDQIVPF
jgi:hypothetical protein